MANQIDCIEKEDRDDPFTAIKYVGGINPDGTRWKISQQDAIRRIKSNQNVFYVQEGQRRVDVVVAKSRAGNDYIKTVADDFEPNNLLKLSSCTWK